LRLLDQQLLQVLQLIEPFQAARERSGRSDRQYAEVEVPIPRVVAAILIAVADSNDGSQCGYEQQRHVDCRRPDAADTGYGSLSGCQSPGSNACPVSQPVALLHRFVFQLLYIQHAGLTGNARGCRKLLSSYAASASAQARRSSPHLSPDETFIN
jgi:hypothetical protein